MTIEDAIYTKLSSDASVSGIVSDRVYPYVASSSATLPYVVFQKVSGGPINQNTGSTGTINVRIQIDVLHDNYEDCRTLAEAVFSAMDGWRDVSADPSVSSCLMVEERDDFDEPQAAGRQFVYRVIQDYSIWYS